jgi:hypothetical protein
MNTILDRRLDRSVNRLEYLDPIIMSKLDFLEQTYTLNITNRTPFRANLSKEEFINEFEKPNLPVLTNG